MMCSLDVLRFLFLTAALIVVDDYSDLDKMQGTWAIESFTINGVKSPGGCSWSFAGGTRHGDPRAAERARNQRHDLAGSSKFKADKGDHCRITIYRRLEQKGRVRLA